MGVAAAGGVAGGLGDTVYRFQGWSFLREDWNVTEYVLLHILGGNDTLLKKKLRASELDSMIQLLADPEMCCLMRITHSRSCALVNV